MRLNGCVFRDPPSRLHAAAKWAPLCSTDGSGSKNGHFLIVYAYNTNDDSPSTRARQQVSSRSAFYGVAPTRFVRGKKTKVNLKIKFNYEQYVKIETTLHSVVYGHKTQKHARTASRRHILHKTDVKNYREKLLLPSSSTLSRKHGGETQTFTLVPSQTVSKARWISPGSIVSEGSQQRQPARHLELLNVSRRVIVTLESCFPKLGPPTMNVFSLWRAIEPLKNTPVVNDFPMDY